MGRNFDYERAAQALVYAEVYGKAAAAREFNVSRKSIYNWRDRVKEDETLRVMYTETKRSFLHHWAEEASPVLRKGLKKLDRMIEKIPEDPKYANRILQILGNVAHLVNVKTAIDRRYGQPDHVPDDGHSDSRSDDSGDASIHRIRDGGGRADAG